VEAGVCHHSRWLGFNAAPFPDALYRAVLRKLETLRLKHLSTIDFAEKVSWEPYADLANE
jgi:hypothetical protein